jgi:3-methyladenine DNA glycosylase AlkD
LIDLLEQHADPLIAAGQQAYMKGRYRFHGVKTPLRRSLMKEFITRHGWPTDHHLEAALMEAWGYEERELHYCAVEVFQRAARTAGTARLPVAEELVRTNSWWDTVDPLAVHVIGAILLRHRAAVGLCNKRWLESGELWDLRVALIFQLQWKEGTDRDLLFSNCTQLSSHPDFFIRKGIGWALRQYARIEPLSVQRFVEGGSFSPLTVREALKHF